MSLFRERSTTRACKSSELCKSCPRSFTSVLSASQRWILKACDPKCLRSNHRKPRLNERGDSNVWKTLKAPYEIRIWPGVTVLPEACLTECESVWKPEGIGCELLLGTCQSEPTFPLGGSFELGRRIGAPDSELFRRRKTEHDISGALPCDWLGWRRNTALPPLISGSSGKCAPAKTKNETVTTKGRAERGEANGERYKLSTY